MIFWCVLYREEWEMKMFLQRLNGKKIVIYGTGHVARKFYKTMVKYGFQEHIMCFVRTKNVSAGEFFEGIPVYCFEEVRVDSTMLICIAVHESLHIEIEDIVKQRTKEYIWIYPHLYAFMFGKPEQQNIELQISSLIHDYQDDLRLGVRLAAIEQQDQKNTYGFDFYIRAQRLHCDKDTAIQRLEQFMRLAAEWKHVGYKKNYVLVLNRNYGVIDGNHRMAMAIYTGQKTICADVYPTDLAVKDIHGEEPMLEKELLLQNAFTIDEVQQLEVIQKKYIMPYRKED